MTFDEWFELKKEKCEVYGNGDDFCVDDEIKHFCKMAWDEQQKQIEKMKCCQNCRKFHNLSYDCTCAEVCNEWELREIKEK